MIKNSQNRSFLFKNRVKLKSHFYYKNLTAVTMLGILRRLFKRRCNLKTRLDSEKSFLKVLYNELSGTIIYVNSCTRTFSEINPPPEGAYKVIPLFKGSDAGCIVFNSPNKGVVIDYRTQGLWDVFKSTDL